MTGKPWGAMKPSEFDTQAPDVQLSMFPEPDNCGSFTDLFSDSDSDEGE